jgi:hypothetical protein
MLNAKQANLEGDLILNQREQKYLLDAHSAFTFWELASARLQPHRRDYYKPLMFIRTTYFDTPDFAYYRGLGSTVSRRLRAREYAASADMHAVPQLSGECVLELKQSASGLRSKSRVHVPAGDVGSYLANMPSARADRPLVPCMTTWYQRAALTDDKDRIRVTLDSRVRFCAPVAVGTPITAIEPDEVLANGPPFILEIKLWEDPPAWLGRAMAGLEEAVGFSKFMAGMRAAEACGLLDRRPGEEHVDSVDDEQLPRVASLGA